MSTNQNTENGPQFNNNTNNINNNINNNNNNNNYNNMCRCGQGDPNMWTNRPSDTSAEKQSGICPNCQIIKSGHLLVSSKGIGWTSWKKRYFVLTRTSLIFFRHDPNVPPIRGTEPNATLGGMDLNNSGSVVVKADRKLLTVSFPDGRTFTLKSETTEDLNEWKSALEYALIHAPNASNSLGQNGIFRPDASDQLENPSEQHVLNEKQTVIHMPAEFALQDENGNASFLEKALCFIEDYGIKVEGILRQSADVEEVKKRVHDYEQGKDEFLPNEDAHVIGDCIKLVLREMPGYPVPAACCTTLVEVFRTERNGRLDAMRDVIYDTFPEPNRLLLQRILRMMLVVSSHKADNRMSVQALSACMAPLLLRPLLVGDLEGDFNQMVSGDNSIQLLQAAAAANHAQAIVTILLEEFDHIFDDEEEWSEGYTDSEGHEEQESNHEEESSENEHHDNDEEEEYSEEEDDDDVTHEDDDITHENENEQFLHSSSDESETLKLTPINNKSQSQGLITHPKNETNDKKEIRVPNSSSSTSNSQQIKEIVQNKELSNSQVGKEKEEVENSNEMMHHASLSRAFKLSDRSDNKEPAGKISDIKVTDQSVKRQIMFGRTSARKNLSMESIEMNISDDDEQVIQKLESTKMELQSKLAEERKENESLQANLERRKETLYEKKLSLEKELEKLREQLKQEKKLRALLETGLTQSSNSDLEIDNKVLADLEDVAIQEEEILKLKQKVLDLKGQSNNQLEQSYASLRDFCNKKLTKDAISKKSVLNDESDNIFEDFINAHGVPTPCPPPETKNNERKNNLPPRSVKSSRSSSSSSFGEDINYNNDSNNNEYNTNNNNNNNNVNISNSNANKPPPSRRFFSRVDNSKREKESDASSSVQKDPMDLGTILAKKSSHSSSSESGAIPQFALARLTNRLLFLKERKAQIAKEIEAMKMTKS